MSSTTLESAALFAVESSRRSAEMKRLFRTAPIVVVADLEEEFREEAEECASARKELAAATTDEELDRALTKMDILSSN